MVKYSLSFYLDMILCVVDLDVGIIDYANRYYSDAIETLQIIIWLDNIDCNNIWNTNNLLIKLNSSSAIHRNS